MADSLKKPLFALLLVAGSLLLLSGCATTDTGSEQQESDIPWNAPQSWEGAPGIPGLEAR